MAPIRCRFDQTAVWHSDAARGPSTPSFNYLVGDGKQIGAGRDLLKQLQPFAADVPLERDEAGRVAARPRQAIDKAGADRIADTREHRRHGAAHLSQWP